MGSNLSFDMKKKIREKQYNCVTVSSSDWKDGEEINITYECKN